VRGIVEIVGLEKIADFDDRFGIEQECAEHRAFRFDGMRLAFEKAGGGDDGGRCGFESSQSQVGKVCSLDRAHRMAKKTHGELPRC
jgi:hypothetical protein